MATSKEERRMRIIAVQGWIAKGVSTPGLHRRIEETYDLLSYSARRALIKEAIEDLYPKEWVDNIRSTNFSRTDEIIERAMQEGKEKLALDAIDLQNKMAGVYTEKHEHSFKDGVIKIKFGE